MQFTRVSGDPGTTVPLELIDIGLRMAGLDKTEIEAPPIVSDPAISTAIVTVPLAGPAIITGVAGQPVVPDETMQTVPTSAPRAAMLFCGVADRRIRLARVRSVTNAIVRLWVMHFTVEL
jgi:hypothetical protein